MRQIAAASYQEAAMHAAAHNDDDTSNDLFEGGTVYCPACGLAFSPLCDRCPQDRCRLLARSLVGDRMIGRLLDHRFRVVEVLAQGAMGTVYQGVQVSVKRPVAIKVIRDDLGHDPATVQRFLREARLLTRIAHPNIVDVFDFGETPDGLLYIVMELLRGQTLDVALSDAGCFSVRRTCEVGLQLCDALVAAHQHGIVHRDLKPANICLLPELGDWVKVLDFGLAKSFHSRHARGSGMYPMPDTMDELIDSLSETMEADLDAANEITLGGVLLGTPMYMAPEAIYAEAVDPRTDLYSFGCILHEMLTGMPPFYGESSAVVLARQLDDPPPPLPDHVPPTLRQLVTALLAKDPNHRPANALTVRAVLEHCFAAELIQDMPTLVQPALPDADEKP
jgi:serine/threonine-protein kinase